MAPAKPKEAPITSKITFLCGENGHALISSTTDVINLRLWSQKGSKLEQRLFFELATAILDQVTLKKKSKV